MHTVSASCASLLLALGPGTVEAAPANGDTPSLRRNFGTQLSEDKATDAALETAHASFLGEARSGKLTDRFVDPDHVSRHGLFFDEVMGMVSTERRIFDVPTVLKSYPQNASDHLITVAFTGHQEDVPFTYRILEFKAVPHGDGYRFFCPLDDRTRSFKTTTIEDVTYQHSGSLDLEAAAEFARFRADLCELTHTEPTPLNYYKFETLDELLNSHGILISATKCNFLCEEVLEKHGFDAALRLVHSGEKGEPFFANLKAILGVDEPEFHQTILKLISTERSSDSPTSKK